MTETDQNGRFRFTRLLPGRYRIAAWTGEEPPPERWREIPVAAGDRIELALTVEGGER